MNTIAELHKLNFEFYKLLCSNDIDRDEKINKCNEFLDKQEKLLPGLTQSKDEQSRKLLEEIFDITPKIESKLKSIHSEIKKDLSRVKNTKKFSNKNPTHSSDGTFFDKKL